MKIIRVWLVRCDQHFIEHNQEMVALRKRGKGAVFEGETISPPACPGEGLMGYLNNAHMFKKWLTY